MAGNLSAIDGEEPCSPHQLTQLPAVDEQQHKLESLNQLIEERVGGSQWVVDHPSKVDPGWPFDEHVEIDSNMNQILAEQVHR